MKWDDPNDDVVQQLTPLKFICARLRSKARYDRDRCTGISSDAMALWGVDEAPPPTARDYPADRYDLRACERTYLMAPDEVRERMLPVLETYRVHVGVLMAQRAKRDAELAKR